MRNFLDTLKQHLNNKNGNGALISQMLENLLQHKKMDVLKESQVKTFKILFKTIEKIAIEYLKSDDNQINAFLKIIYSKTLPSKSYSQVNKELLALGAHMIFIYYGYEIKNSAVAKFKKDIVRNADSLIIKPLFDNFSVQDVCMLLIIQFVDGKKLYCGIHQINESYDLEIYFGTTINPVINQRLQITNLILSTEYNIDIHAQLKASCRQI